MAVRAQGRNALLAHVLGVGRLLLQESDGCSAARLVQIAATVGLPILRGMGADKVAEFGPMTVGGSGEAWVEERNCLGTDSTGRRRKGRETRVFEKDDRCPNAFEF